MEAPGNGIFLEDELPFENSYFQGICWFRGGMFIPHAPASLLQVVLGCGLNGHLHTGYLDAFGALGYIT